MKRPGPRPASTSCCGIEHPGQAAIIPNPAVESRYRFSNDGGHSRNLRRHRRRPRSTWRYAYGHPFSLKGPPPREESPVMVTTTPSHASTPGDSRLVTPETAPYSIPTTLLTAPFAERRRRYLSGPRFGTTGKGFGNLRCATFGSPTAPSRIHSAPVRSRPEPAPLPSWMRYRQPRRCSTVSWPHRPSCRPA